MQLNFLRLRLTFLVPFASIHFPPGGAANVIRGALGNMLRRLDCSPACLDSTTCTLHPACSYRCIFAPAAQDAPSGLAQPPRPFVLRAAALNGLRVSPGGIFSFDIHLFLLQPELVRKLIAALSQLAQEGLGPTRESAVLQTVCALNLNAGIEHYLFKNNAFTSESASALALNLMPWEHAPSQVEVHFLTPTELKGTQDPARPEFATLIARLRDRISSLRHFYGDGALPIAFRELEQRARAVRIVSSNLEPMQLHRRSSRTGQVHSLGGWTGSVRYAGELSWFMPYLQAGQWTGVGRQTVWGNGQLLLATAELS